METRHEVVPSISIVDLKCYIGINASCIPKFDEGFLLNFVVGMLYRSMFGDEALGGLNIRMVEVARKVGAASKFTGSGGAVVAFCPEGTSQVKLLEDECKKEGFVIQPIEPFPSRLSEIELKTLQTK